MKLSDLQKFVEIVGAGGLTQAAHRLGVTQPALSRTVRDLETRMQAQLLRRTGRGIELTPAGEVFFAFAQETLAGFEASKRQIMQVSENLPKQLLFAAPLRTGRLLTPDLHREFAQRMPETTLHFVEENSDRSAELLAGKRIDAAIVYITPAMTWPEATPMFSEALHAVGSGSLLGADPAPLAFSDLARLPLLIPSRGSYRSLIDTVFAECGRTPVVARELETADALLAFAAEREGVALLPYSNVYQECARREVIARPVVQPEIARVLALQPGGALGRDAARIVATTVRTSMARVAHIARWRALARPTPRPPAHPSKSSAG